MIFPLSSAGCIPSSARRLAVARTLPHWGRAPVTLKRAGDAELFHPKLQSGTIQAQTYGCPIRARENPLRLLKSCQDFCPLHFFQCLECRLIFIWNGPVAELLKCDL